MNKYAAKLTYVVDSGVSIVLNKDDYKVYTETEEQLERYNAYQNLIDAFKQVLGDGMKYKVSKLFDITDNRIHSAPHTGELRPNPYNVKKS